MTAEGRSVLRVFIISGTSGPAVPSPVFETVCVVRSVPVWIHQGSQTDCSGERCRRVCRWLSLSCWAERVTACRWQTDFLKGLCSYLHHIYRKSNLNLNTEESFRTQREMIILSGRASKNYRHPQFQHIPCCHWLPWKCQLSENPSFKWQVENANISYFH